MLLKVVTDQKEIQTDRWQNYVIKVMKGPVQNAVIQHSGTEGWFQGRRPQKGKTKMNLGSC